MSLITTLKDYQTKTTEWMLNRETTHGGGMILHEPGMGKTLISLSLIVQKPLRTLIVCPSNLIDNWVNEFHKHTTIHPVVYHKHLKHRNKCRPLITSSDDTVCVVTSYGIISKYELHGIKFDRIILDEGHHIRNINTGQSKSCISLKATNKWIMTATPIVNTYKDVIPYAKFMNAEFNISRASPFQRLKSAHEFIQNHGIRMTKDSVMNMPKRTIHTIQVEMFQEEYDLYEAFLDFYFDTLNRVKTLPIMKKTFSTFILTVIMRLKQCCVSPAMLIYTMNDVRNVKTMNEAVEIIKKFNDDKYCPICYETKPTVPATCGHACCHSCWNDLLARKPQCPMCRQEVNKNILFRNCIPSVRSGDPLFYGSRIQKLVDMITPIIHKGDKVVIASQWVTFIDILVTHPAFHGIHVQLTGRQTLSQRTKNIQQFNNDSSIKICIVSLLASSEGINLVAGNHVFLMDMWWNDAKIEQMMDRVHRIGQTKPVHVYRFKCDGTIEDNIDRLVSKKAMIGKAIISNDELKEDNQEFVSKNVMLIEPREERDDSEDDEDSDDSEVV
jgi:SWI/SNF-related matrix-associated actin-dependent regulator of chromatin subfamily A3